MREFGLAYDRFREEDHAVFDRFLDLAVAELAEDGKIAPVRLALFAQMLKDKPWTPATLKDMRGLEGIGVKFLEESLDGESANPEHRLNVLAARHVLRALLPYGATDIKGHMRSYDELLEVSGYARRPADFDTLLSILGTELRLITPTDPRGPMPATSSSPMITPGRYYHLTHDYLGPFAARMAHSQGSARRSPARPRSVSPNGRRSGPRVVPIATCPPWWEWLVIVLFTRRSRRSPAERRLCRCRDPLSRGRAARSWRRPRPCSASSSPIGSVACRARAAVRELGNAEAAQRSQGDRESRILSPVG